jgi:AcrR family transcriptional regulator
MTEKQEKILQTALQLFAKEGFYATSTSKIAKDAGVSEGLIFRHFKNKEGLLDAILKVGEERVKNLFSTIIFETEPKFVIRNYLNILLEIASNQEEMEFWKLQYKIKWETENYNEHKMEPVVLTLTNAFSKLAYSAPEKEVKLLMATIDGLAMQLFLMKSFDVKPVIDFLKEKYNV